MFSCFTVKNGNYVIQREVTDIHRNDNARRKGRKLGGGHRNENSLRKKTPLIKLEIFNQQQTTNEIRSEQKEGKTDILVDSFKRDILFRSDIGSSSEILDSKNELGILHNDKKKAVKVGTMWVSSRGIFKKFMARANMNFLRNVKTLNEAGDDVLRKVISSLKFKYFPPKSTIVKQREKGLNFYIIRSGRATITKEGEGEVGHYGKGQYFGETALLGDGVHRSTVTADAPRGVECLTLGRQQFLDHFGALLTVPAPRPNIIRQYQDVSLDNLKVIATLGTGGFGRVDLVQHRQKNLIFALKYLKKIDIVEQNQQEHVYNEKTILMECESKFIIRLYCSYKSNKYIYFLMEACLGGDLWALLQRQKFRKFEEKHARFFAACVLEGVAYLHERGIIYRDLKPENLLIDEEGYVKLTDFGFAKKLRRTEQTFTFAGTPEYVAPEIILNRGQDKAVDFWAFGVLIFELITGRTPFRTNRVNHLRTYSKILDGIDSVDFPPWVTPKGRNIIKKLCKPMPTERLGYKNGARNIRNHGWFSGFDWIKFNQGKLPAPFKPKLKSVTDTRYFGSFEEDTDVPPEEMSGWDEDF